MSRLQIDLITASENLFFIFSPVQSNMYYPDMWHWFKSNKDTRFKWAADDEFQNNFATLQLVKSKYPKNVKLVATITNPWSVVFFNYISHFKKNHTLTLNKFVDNLYVYGKEYSFFQNEETMIDREFIFRNEYIETDFLKLSNLYPTTTPLKIETAAFFNHKKLFDNKSNDIILDIFEKDIEYFYSDFS